MDMDTPLNRYMVYIGTTYGGIIEETVIAESINMN